MGRPVAAGGPGGGARRASGGGARSGSVTVSPPGVARCVSSLGPRQDGGPVSGRPHTETRCDGEGKVSGWDGGAAPRARRPPPVLRVSLRIAPLRGLRAAAALARPGPSPALTFPLAEPRACGSALRCDWRWRPSLSAGVGVGPPSRPPCLALPRLTGPSHLGLLGILGAVSCNTESSDFPRPRCLLFDPADQPSAALCNGVSAPERRRYPGCCCCPGRALGCPVPPRSRARLGALWESRNRPGPPGARAGEAAGASAASLPGPREVSPL